MADGEETTQQSSTEEAPEVSGESTPEAIEAYWRNRISGSDKAHAAEVRALREENAALRGTGSEGTASTEAVTTGNAPAANELVERLQKELQQERIGRVVDTRTAKYPEAAAALGDPAVLSAMDEGKLAALNESLRPAARPSPVDSNNPARGLNVPKKLEDMSIEELRAHLRTQPAPTGY